MVGSHGAKPTRIGIQMERQGMRLQIEIGRIAHGEYGIDEGVRIIAQVSIEWHGGGISIENTVEGESLREMEGKYNTIVRK